MNNVGIKTFYKFYSVNPNTLDRVALTGWCSNSILTSGRNEMANRNWFTSCQLGTDSTSATSTQTGLLGYVAGTSTITDDIYGAQASAPYYGWRRKTFRFAVGSGIANENLNEVGIG